MERFESEWRRRRAALHRAMRERHGVMSTGELRELGWSASAVDRLVHDGQLVRVTRGVYRSAGAPTTDLGTLRGDLLRAGPGAALTGRSSAWVFGHLRYRPLVSEIAKAGGSGFRRSAAMDRGLCSWIEGDADVVTVQGLRCCSPFVTILKLAEDAGDEGSRRVLRRVLRGAAADDPGLVPRLRRAAEGSFRGVRALRDELKEGLERTLVIRSSVEDRFVELCKRYGLPVPVTNAVVHGVEIDALFADHDAFVEIDTWGTHGDEISFERDREKIARLIGLGLRGFQVTDRRIDHDPAGVARDVEGLLGLRRH